MDLQLIPNLVNALTDLDMIITGACIGIGFGFGEYLARNWNA